MGVGLDPRVGEVLGFGYDADFLNSDFPLVWVVDNGTVTAMVEGGGETETGMTGTASAIAGGGDTAAAFVGVRNPVDGGLLAEENDPDLPFGDAARDVGENGYANTDARLEFGRKRIDPLWSSTSASTERLEEEEL